MRLPLLDMRQRHESPAAFAEELRIACHRFGFFQLRHRIPDHVAERAMNEVRLFFARPVEEKQRIGYPAAVWQQFGVSWLHGQWSGDYRWEA